MTQKYVAVNVNPRTDTDKPYVKANLEKLTARYVAQGGLYTNDLQSALLFGANRISYYESKGYQAFPVHIALGLIPT